MRLSALAWAAWERLPPRSTDPEIIAASLGDLVFHRSVFRCVICCESCPPGWAWAATAAGLFDDGACWCHRAPVEPFAGPVRVREWVILDRELQHGWQPIAGESPHPRWRSWHDSDPYYRGILRDGDDLLLTPEIAFILGEVRENRLSLADATAEAICIGGTFVRPAQLQRLLDAIAASDDVRSWSIVFQHPPYPRQGELGL